MSAPLVDHGVDAIVDRAIDTDPQTIYVINPGLRTVRHLIESLEPEGNAPNFRVMAAEGVLKEVMSDFLVGSRAADLIEAGNLALRVRNGPPENSVLVADDRVVALITIDDRVAGLSTDRREFVDRLQELYESRWENASRFSLRTPPLSEVRRTLANDIGDAALADFDAILSSLETARGEGHDLDEVTISLLVAARNSALLYDISKWGEDIGIASKATFSRTKTELEEEGLIVTEKVPIEVGRPRLRLQLGTDRLREADPGDLADEAISALA